MADVERLTRNKQRAPCKRDAAASHIEAIYNLGLSASTDRSIIPKFLLAIFLTIGHHLLLRLTPC